MIPRQVKNSVLIFEVLFYTLKAIIINITLARA